VSAYCSAWCACLQQWVLFTGAVHQLQQAGLVSSAPGLCVAAADDLSKLQASKVPGLLWIIKNLRWGGAGMHARYSMCRPACRRRSINVMCSSNAAMVTHWVEDGVVIKEGKSGNRRLTSGAGHAWCVGLMGVAD
jgi:hypothetical protein